MTKDHLKRIAAPRTWPLDRKQNKYVVRPHPGSHSMEFGFALGLVLRDHIGVCQTLREAQKLLHNNVVTVDGRRMKDRRDMVGLFDVIAFKESQKAYEVVLAPNGKLAVREVDFAKTSAKVARVLGKAVVSGGKIQLRLHDGRTVLFDGKVRVGDSVMFTFDSKKVTEVMPLEKGARVLLIRGKHIGSVGTFQSAEDDLASYQTDDKKTIETATKSLFVVPKGWTNN